MEATANNMDTALRSEVIDATVLDLENGSEKEEEPERIVTEREPRSQIVFVSANTSKSKAFSCLLLSFLMYYTFLLFSITFRFVIKATVMPWVQASAFEREYSTSFARSAVWGLRQRNTMAK
jgi:hypothetical protein